MRAVNSSDQVLIGMGSRITAARLGANLIEVLQVIREARYTDTSGVLWSKDPRIVVALHTVTLSVPENICDGSSYCISIEVSELNVVLKLFDIAIVN